ncbi:hypothetical protein RA19_06280 [Leisingera sp. ANG-M1]|uniref:LysR family transcriptional regulator n=1 Tax=Leisingera sp. ANG-M1 TaxID=1577895 RepID=UPI0005806CCC|nr:LysR family transcriptional regulator [Leisingera sp. ANG-M1]KIC11631.1 hypothetical protein RA19_06280 [Leisingera sp. ANG-M1]
MNIKQLRLFYEIHSSGSLTYAADRICVTQPAASKLLRSLEEEVGMKLFSRDGRNLRPNPGTEHLFEEVRGLLERFDDLNRSFAATSEGGRGKVVVSGTVGIMMGLIADQAQRLLEKSPGIQLELWVNDCQQIRELAATGQIDIGLTDADTGSHRYSSQHFKMECLAAVHQSQAGVLPERLRFEDLDGANWITFGSRHGMLPQLRQAYIESGGLFRSGLFVDNTLQALQLVDLKMGMTIVDPISHRHSLDNALYPNVRYKKLQRPFFEAIDLVWPNCRRLSPPAQLLLNAVKEKLAEF